LSAKNNFGLDEEAFDLLKSKLKDGDTVLFEQIFLSHFDSCIRYIVKNFNATRDNAYDCVMQSLLDFRQKLVDDRIRYGNLRYLFTRMAANRYIDEHYRGKKTEEKALLEQWITNEDYMEFSSEDRLQISKMINMLGEKCKDLLKKHLEELRQLFLKEMNTYSKL